MKGEPIRDYFRLGPHVVEAMKLLREIGAEDIQVYRTKHILFEFMAGPEKVQIRMPCTPRSEGDQIDFFRQQIGRALRQKLSHRGGRA
ncbi:hypothetical protein [Blastochloris tepida]|uniref:Uncharacterized protein n=1 Tax=Blastochloris tepida TaxID=2233851 RepID=A0A348FZD6_9HYPH|nr:hypothetical protein [Blastochloris tepida]BBF92669.1 hypothetical protein BLTE_13540 [Blastochloris tepida]